MSTQRTFCSYSHYLLGQGFGSVLKKSSGEMFETFSPWGGLLCRMGMKKLHFSTNISLYLRNDTRYGDSCNGRRIGTCMQSIAVSDFVVMQAVSAVVELVFFITYTLLLMVI